MSEVMKFDDEFQEVPVKIGDTDYTLREASGAAAAAWRNSIMKSAKLGPDGKPVSMGEIANSEPLLVSLCLFTADGKPVSLSRVQSLKSSIVKALFEKAKAISGLDEDAPDGDGEEAKNEQSGTQAG